MTDIWNLNAICRCCHADGSFTSLCLKYTLQDRVVTYSTLLLDTLSIHMSPPSIEASYSICDECIQKLEQAARFKDQVLNCERKFMEYVQNEQVFADIKEENSEHEYDYVSNASDNEDSKLNINKYEIKENDDETKVVSLDSVKEEDTQITIEVPPVDTKQGDEERTVQKRPVAKSKATSKTDNPKQKKTVTARKNMKSATTSKVISKTYKGNTGKTIARKKNMTKKDFKLSYDVSLEIKKETDSGTDYSCGLCGGSFENESVMKDHILSTHSYYYCEMCNKKFNNVTKLKRHIAYYHKPRRQCDRCDKTFPTTYALKEHRNSHMRVDVFICDICRKEFLYKKTLQRHLLWHKGMLKKVLCDLCGHSFNDKTQMTKHLQGVHQNLRLFKCELCQKSYKANKHLKKHMLIHSGVKPFHCDMCDKRFYVARDLKDHKKVHRTSFDCRYCFEKFKTKRDYLMHLRFCHKKPSYNTCEFCGKVLACKFSLNRHLLAHQGIKKYNCDACGQKFAQKCILDRHIKRQHTDIPEIENKKEKFKCNLCKFSVYDLEKHMSTHLNRPHKCELCGKGYPERNTLTRHIQNVHFGRKSHACDVCGKKYTNIATLRKHINKLHGVKTENKSTVANE